MSNTPEGKVKAKVRDIFRAFDLAYCHVPGSAYGTGGVGDYICCVNGIYLEVEVKSLESKGKGKQTELQKIRCKEVLEAKGYYVVVNEDRLDALEQLIGALLGIGFTNRVVLSEEFSS
jgi:hypothetical protein